jgi:putative glutamine amidotransferase
MGIRKPVIGVPVNLLMERNGSFPGMERAFVNQDYLKSLRLAGGTPIALPFALEREDQLAQLALLDGLLFAGGADLNPLLFGEEPQPGLEEVYQEMDEHQLALARLGRDLGLPMLGICRGLQVLNVAFGGTLHQDLDASLLQHVQKGQRHGISHTVELEEGTRLARLFGQASVGTNSFHHQAVKVLAPGFRVNARTRDGVIEGFEELEGSFVLAVQWHPEGMVERHPTMLRLFQALIDACGMPPA